MNIRRYILGAACLLGVIQTQAQRWDTYFAYNNVSQIALTPDHVYAVSDGSLFSVEKQTEKQRVGPWVSRGWVIRRLSSHK